jgi:CubicO group peptidase (beta-lactamase class C family)
MQSFRRIPFVVLTWCSVAVAQGDRVDAVVKASMQASNIPGVQVVVVRDGKTVKDGAYGLVDVALQVPVTSRSVFPVASVTKVFAAAAVLSLVEAGKLRLESPVGELLPDLPEPWRPVRVRQLLNHTSGLPDVVVNPVRGEWLGRTRDEALAKAGALPMQSQPGTAWSYNQTNYVLLGLLIEKCAGATFEAFAEQRFFTPLAMTATRFGDSLDVVPGRGPWYTRLDWSNEQPKLSKTLHQAMVTYPDYVRTAAGLNTTAGELATWVEAVVAGKLLRPETLTALWTSTTLADGQTFRMGDTLGVGLGWLVDDRPGHKAVGGSGGSCVAFRHYLPDHLTVVVLTNCQGIDPDGLVDDIAGCFIADLQPAKK